MKCNRIALLALALSGCAFADSNVFIAVGNQQFGVVDVNNGAYSQRGSLGFIPAGLGEINNVVYTGMFGGTTLFSVNTSNGATSAIGDGSTTFFALGSTANALYTLDQSGALYSISPTTGATTFLGSTGISVGSNFTGISTGSNLLYVTVGQNLYSINPTVSTAATLIGSTGVGAIGALVAENGSVFGTSVVNSNAVYQMNLSTGNAVYTSFLQAPDYAYGLAPDIPEPPAVALLVVAGLIAGGYALRRRRIAAAA
jgi:hypothetical protein